MKEKNNKKTLKKYLCYGLYYFFARYLPPSYSRFSFGSKKIRGYLVKNFVSHAGQNINVEKGAIFSQKIVIGNNSGIGVNCTLDGPVTIGNDVMIGPNVEIYTRNHRHDRIDVPMNSQGDETYKEVIIGNDVWIGSRVIILPGVTIGNGAILGAASVISKNVEPYTIVVGNPARKVKSRI
ncbi:acyltransferase [Peribacillus butanolivorans]|uniref:acyltransferase n=1 Tax=Peribacillus butanolivorans TaxID=421767 RepID=UPI00366DEE11